MPSKGLGGWGPSHTCTRVCGQRKTPLTTLTACDSAKGSQGFTRDQEAHLSCPAWTDNMRVSLPAVGEGPGL